MFSGIIERPAFVATARPTESAIEIELETGFADLALGESIAVNGVCLTVTHFDGAGRARFFISPETIARSALGQLASGHKVNLERSVKLETRLSGHFVQGHVDGLARLVERVEEGGAYRHHFALPAALARYCVEKGSIALDGISLTINSISPGTDGSTIIGITIIPHTWERTNLHATRLGDEVNVEVDVIAKYVERLCQPYPKP